MTAQERQSLGKEPAKVRDTGHHKLGYIKSSVEKWDRLTDWRYRAESEGDFFIQRLEGHGARRGLDGATGTGLHSVRLLNEGFEVVSVDGSVRMLARAFGNGLAHGGHTSRTVHADWRWLNRDVHGEFDAIICLGNPVAEKACVGDPEGDG